MNLTTPAIVIKPISGGKDPAAVAADLRAIADVIQDNPHLAAMIAQLFERSLWPIHAVAYDQRDDPRAVMAGALRQFMTIASGPAEKHYDSDYFKAAIPLRAVKLRLTDERSQVCTRMVTGTETVTEEIPDPGYIAAAPMVTVTSERDVVEWKCEPLMGSRD